jgi:hypothetical protein
MGLFDLTSAFSGIVERAVLSSFRVYRRRFQPSIINSINVDPPPLRKDGATGYCPLGPRVDM